MTKILYIHPKNDFTGSTRVLATEFEHLYVGNKFDVITFYNKGEGFLSSKNVYFHKIYFPKFKDKEIPIITSLIYRISFIIKLLLIGNKFDIFYINTILPFYASWIAKIYKKKIIWHIHEKFVKPSIGERLAEWVFDNTSAHRIFVSKYTKSQYADNMNSTSEIRYNRLSQKFIKNVLFQPFEKRTRRNVTMIASLSINKGIDIFIDVSKILSELSFTLILSTKKENIDNYFSSKVLPSNIVIIPAVPNIQPYLQQTDLMLNLTNSKYSIETFGMTILEAMPYGIPSIVPNIGGPIEIIEHGVNGYCIDTTNPDIVAKYIRKALSKERYNVLAVNSLKKFYNLFNNFEYNNHATGGL